MNPHGLIWEQSGPLAVLVRKLQPGPPSISYLIELFDETESLQEFVALVREYLPDHYAEIMSNDLEGRLVAFCRLFSENYFPIQESDYLDEGYWPLVGQIPIPRMGIDWEEYHDFGQWHEGLRMLFALVASPYTLEDGERIALLEDVGRIAGEDVAARIPPEGWRPDELHARLDNTQYEGAALAADWLWRQTDAIFLNISYEDDLTDNLWDRGTVDMLTREWALTTTIQDRIANLWVWLEDDPKVRFGELVDFMRRKGRPPKGRQKALIEVFAGGEALEDRLLDGLLELDRIQTLEVAE